MDLGRLLRVSAGQYISVKPYLSNGEAGAWAFSMISTTLVSDVNLPGERLIKEKIGGLIAAGITYGTSTMESTWAWRIPSIFQGLFSVLCILILPFIPESPRWLAYEDRKDEALQVVAQTYANGDASDPIVLIQFKEIVDTIGKVSVLVMCELTLSAKDFEKNVGETLSMKQMIRTPIARKRVIIACSVAVFSTLAGNIIASYYLGTMLTNAGIISTTTQLQIVSLSSFARKFC